MNPLVGIVVFSLVETLAVVFWAAIVFKPDTFTNAQLVGGIVLFALYIVEHVIAFNVGKNRPWLSFPRP